MNKNSPKVHQQPFKGQLKKLLKSCSKVDLEVIHKKMQTKLEKLNTLLSFLEAEHPLPKHMKIKITFHSTQHVVIDNPVHPALAQVPAFFLPITPTEGHINIAVNAKDPLLALAHEWKHAHQLAQQSLSEANRWDNEIEAVIFARITIKDFLKAA